MDADQKRIEGKQTTNKQNQQSAKITSCSPHYRIRDSLPWEIGYPNKPVIEYYCEVHGTSIQLY